jgi:hypothetical protein
MGNIAFIDGQNLHLGTREDRWKIGYRKFSIYLKEHYKITKAYYFIGYFSQGNLNLYRNLCQSGFSLVFKAHQSDQLAK